MRVIIFQGALYFLCWFLVTFSYSHPAFSQEPNFSMYHYTPMLTNPGWVGPQKAGSVRVNYRHQSLSTGDQIQTAMLSGYYPVSIGNHRLSFSGAFIHDKSSDYLKTAGGMFGASYQVQVTKLSMLSLGFQAGYFHRKIGFDYSTDSQYVNGGLDPNADSGETLYRASQGYMAASTGLFWLLKDKRGDMVAFAGLALFNFNKPTLSFLQESSDELPVSWKSTAGWRVYKQMHFSIMPTVRWVHQAQNNFVNAGALFRYAMDHTGKEAVALGLWYNTNKAGVFSLEYTLANFGLAASYDLPLSSALHATQQNGIFEIALSFALAKQ